MTFDAHAIFVDCNLILLTLDLEATDHVTGQVKAKNFDICYLFTLRWLAAAKHTELDLMLPKILATVY